MIESLTQWIVDMIAAFGYPGLGLIMFLENIFPPIPSEIVLPLAGSLTLNGTFSLFWVAVVGSIGSVSGAWFFYAFGRLFDETRMRSLINQYGKWMMVSENDLDRALNWFHRYGEWAVFFGRMVPLVRSLISVPAGMAKMDPVRFTLYTALGTAGWTFALALAGRLLGQSWGLVSEAVGHYQDFIVVMLAVILGAFLLSRVFRWWAARKELA